MLNSKHYLASLLISTAMSMSAMPAYATEETTDPYQGNLLGDVGGYRSRLADQGVDVTVEYKADGWSEVSGGIKRGENYLDNLDVKFDLDGEKLFGIHGNKMLISFINNNGSRPNASRVGSTQGIDNIEVGTDTFKLYEAWVDQSFLDDRLSVLMGLHDLNAEFDETDMTANFIKPVMQVGQSFAQSGQNGPSLFPTTSVAMRVRFNPTEETYISAAAFDGVPGNPNRPHGTHIDFNRHDGLLLISEAGYTPKTADSDAVMDKYAIGAWGYTKQMDDLVELDGAGNPVKKRMEGAYLIASHQFYHDTRAGHDLGAYFRAGIADGDTAQVKWDYETGIVGNGWMPGRPDSEIGLGFAQAHNSSKYVQSVAGIADRNEYSAELYYRDSICPGISVQPDVQYIVNPGTDTVTKDATVIGMRLDINF